MAGAWRGTLWLGDSLHILFGANVLVSASIHCAATGEVIPDADFSPCSCVSGSAWGWPEVGEDGWFVGTKGTRAGRFG